jgi:hypothetical protein
VHVRVDDPESVFHRLMASLTSFWAESSEHRSQR